VEEGVVYIPLWQVKGLSSRFLKAWERTVPGGPFVSWSDFTSRTGVDPKEADVLARAGALRGFFSNRHEAVWHASKVKTGKRRSRSRDLFDEAGDRDRAAFKEIDLVKMADWEAELLSYPVSLDPVDLWLADVNRLGTIPVKDLGKYVDREMEIAGIQVCTRLHRTMKGEMMKFVTLADETGMAETVLFPDMYRKFGWELSQNRGARLRVHIEWDDTESGLSLTVTDVR
jgi:DNA polymerase III alpha subunit